MQDLIIVALNSNNFDEFKIECFFIKILKWVIISELRIINFNKNNKK